MSYCLLKDEHAVDLAPALIKCTSLTALHLDGNHFEKCVGPLVVGLTQLEVLYVSYQCDDKHADRCVGLLRHHTLLRTLYMDLGDVGEASIRALAELLPHLPCLEVVDFEWEGGPDDLSVLESVLQRSLSITSATGRGAPRWRDSETDLTFDRNCIRNASLLSMVTVPADGSGMMLVRDSPFPFPLVDA